MKLAFMPFLCDFVALFSSNHQQVLLHTVIKECLDEKLPAKESGKLQVKLLERLFEMFPVTELVENQFEKYLYEYIKNR